MRQVTELKEMQSLALTILKGINEFCSEYKISYYLAYGTLLGAIRHKGFIPWDDDIDLWMKRDEFNILCENFQAWGLSHGLYINSIKTVQNYTQLFICRFLMLMPAMQSSPVRNTHLSISVFSQQ